MTEIRVRKEEGRMRNKKWQVTGVRWLVTIKIVAMGKWQVTNAKLRRKRDEGKEEVATGKGRNKGK
jgi:hypothetical protein